MEEEIAMFKVEGAMVLNSDPIDDYVDDGDRIIAVFKSKASSATAAARECVLRVIPATFWSPTPPHPSHPPTPVPSLSRAQCRPALL